MKWSIQGVFFTFPMYSYQWVKLLPIVGTGSNFNYDKLIFIHQPVSNEKAQSCVSLCPIRTIRSHNCPFVILAYDYSVRIFFLLWSNGLLMHLTRLLFRTVDFGTGLFLLNPLPLFKNPLCLFSIHFNNFPGGLWYIIKRVFL